MTMQPSVSEKETLYEETESKFVMAEAEMENNQDTGNSENPELTQDNRGAQMEEEVEEAD